MPDPAPARTPLGGALDAEIARLDGRITKLWQVIMLLCIAIGAIAAFTDARALGVAAVVSSTLLLGWFALHSALLARGLGGKWLAVGSTVLESAIPWGLLLLIAHTQGAAYALGSWVPPLFVAVLILLATGRLRPLAPLVIGITGGVAFPVLYFAFLRGGLSAAEAARPLYQPSLQLTRGLSLAAGGAVGMVIARALRGAIARAEGVARQKELFGKYRLLHPIASGGMGTVYAALYCPEGGFERHVAIKRVHAHMALQPDLVAAFRREAELCARLVHPNIVQVFDFGSVEGTYFLAMEHIDGLSLQELMESARQKGRKLSAKVVAHIGREILAGLAYSHGVARGSDGALLRVIHRDLSPGNVLLSRHGEVKMADFGIAKVLREAAVSETTTVAGHLGYMAPEQAEAKPLDERCDLFAVGVILWELLSGRRLFRRGGPAPTIVALMTEPIEPISVLRSDIDPGWDAVLERALARTPDERFGSAAEMAAALVALADARGIPCPEVLAAEVNHALAAAPVSE